MTVFFEESKAVADKFLQSIIFVDDKAFSNSEQKTHHDFDAYEVTRNFAEKNKICALYNPRTTADIDMIGRLAKKADIIVLDWQINLDNEPVQTGEEEQDAEEEDPRGPHTLKIITEIVTDPVLVKDGLKLIVVYTGDTDLNEIADKIQRELEQKDIALTRSFCEILVGNLKVIIVAKSNEELDDNGKVIEKFKHLPDYNQRVKSYAELPDYLLGEFTKMTSGLLSNFVLNCLAILRQNVSRLLKIYNKDLDKAFLSHRLLLTNGEDSRQQMIEIFADSIQALLYYNHADDTLKAESVKNWLDTVTINRNITILGNSTPVNMEFWKTWIDDGFKGAVTNLLGRSLNDAEIKTLKNNYDSLSKAPCLLSDTQEVDSKDIEFSILTHHKSIFKPVDIAPKMSLGAVVKGMRTGKYWVCIQQRCDSVRVLGERRFLFLPLDVSTGKFQFVTSDGIKLKLSNKSFDLRTIKFMPDNDEDLIKPRLEGEIFVFDPVYKAGHDAYHQDKDETFAWILDLKDLHAQRIAHDFAHQLSRVGLDESEWLRKRYS